MNFHFTVYDYEQYLDVAIYVLSANQKWSYKTKEQTWWKVRHGQQCVP